MSKKNEITFAPFKTYMLESMYKNNQMPKTFPKLAIDKDLTPPPYLYNSLNYMRKEHYLFFGTGLIGQKIQWN